MNIRQSLRLDRAKSRSLTATKWFLTAVFVLAILMVFVAIYALVVDRVKGDFPIKDIETGETVYTNIKNEIFTFTFVGFHILQVLFLIPILMKHLKVGDDREILLRLPITSRQLLISKLVTIYILEVIFAIIVLLPILIAFGIVSTVGGLYWGMIPIILILAPVLPFLLSVALIIPVSWIVNFIKSRYDIMLLSYLILGLLFVFLYMAVLTQASFMVLNRGLKSELASKYWDIHNAARFFFYQKLFANAIVSASVLGVVYIVLASLLIGGIGLLLAIKVYGYYYNQDVVKSRSIKIREMSKIKLWVEMEDIQQLQNLTKNHLSKNDYKIKGFDLVVTQDNVNSATELLLQQGIRYKSKPNMDGTKVNITANVCEMPRVQKAITALKNSDTDCKITGINLVLNEDNYTKLDKLLVANKIAFSILSKEIKSPTRSYLYKELKSIIRSPNYSFQFLTFVIIMPILVMMCARLAGIATIETFKSSSQNLASISDASKAMILGVTLLSFMIILPLATSFAAISISREGGNVYQCKALPIEYRRQVMIKMLLCFVPILISTIIALFLVQIPQKVVLFTVPTSSIVESLWVFLIVAFISLGLICMGMLLDLQSPICKTVGSGEITKTNRAAGVVLVVGLILALVMSTPVILQQIPFLQNIPIKPILAVFSIVFGGAMFALLFVLSKKLFARVEGA